MSGSDHSLVQLDRECDHIRGKRLRTGRFRKALCPSRREYPLENQLLRISQWACLGRPFGAVPRHRPHGQGQCLPKDSCMRARPLANPLAFGVAGVALVAGTLIFCASHSGLSNSIAGLNREADSSVASLDALLALPSSALQRVDIARMNLLCAQGLAGG